MEVLFYHVSHYDIGLKNKIFASEYHLAFIFFGQLLDSRYAKSARAVVPFCRDEIGCIDGLFRRVFDDNDDKILVDFDDEAYCFVNPLGLLGRFDGIIQGIS